MRYLRVMLLLWLCVSSGSAALLSIQPANQTVSPGQTFSVDIVVSAAVDLFAYGFDLGFDPAVLAANSISEGPFLATGGATFFITGSIDNAAGLISANGNTLLTAIAGVNGGGVLAIVSFTALAPGSSALSPLGISLLDSSLSGIVTTTQAGEVTVGGTAAVPEPSAWLLLGGGLLALGLAREFRG